MVATREQSLKDFEFIFFLIIENEIKSTISSFWKNPMSI